MRVLVLVDGEHYPPGVRAAIGSLRARGDDVVAAVYCGGSEKLKDGDLDAAYGVYVERSDDVEGTLAKALDDHGPDLVLDLADEPVITARDRFRFASAALVRGVVYAGPDFELRPPRLERVLTKPSIRVIATGKRTGKTAVAGALARHAAARHRRPSIIAMGRGGPDDPHVIEAGTLLGPRELLAIADSGGHAASDYLEDAVTTGVTTIGCRRVGGGLAGQPFASNVLAGARIAEGRDEDLVILEGSGSAVPPVAAGAGILVVPATARPEEVTGYLAPLRVLLSDLAVVTMGETDGPADLIASTIRGVSPSIETIRTVFRPVPLSAISRKRIFFCTTAPAPAAQALKAHLEEDQDCEVVGMSHALSDRAALTTDLESATRYDVLLTEIKASAIDVAVRAALGRDSEVVFADNRLFGDGIEEAFDRVVDLADRRSYSK